MYAYWVTPETKVSLLYEVVNIAARRGDRIEAVPRTYGPWPGGL